PVHDHPGAELLRLRTVGNQEIGPLGQAPHGQGGQRRQAVCLGGQAPYNAIPVHQGVTVHCQAGGAVQQEGDLVGDLLQITGDVGGKQDGAVILLHKLQKQIENLLPCDGVQPAGDLVQHQQLRVMGQGGGQVQ